MPRNSDKYFENNAELFGLGSKTARGGIITIAGQGIRFVLQLGSTMILARLLLPDDFGLFGMVLVVVNFLNMFRDFGLSQSLIQRPLITRQEVSNLFWINLLISFILAIGTALIAPCLAKFYGRGELVPVTWLLALGILISGVGLQHRGLMTRQMEFGRLALVEILMMLSGVVVALLMAWFEYGYWALAGQAFAVSVVGTLCVWVFCRWQPSFWNSSVCIRPYLKYGGNLAGFNFLNFFSRNADNIMIGYAWGAGPLGLYTKAYGLLMLPIQQINGPMTKVMLPVLSRLQANDDEYSRFYFTAVKLTIAVTFPVVGSFLAATEPLVLLFLGTGWLGAVPIFQALVPAAFVSALNVTTGWVFQSRGTTDRQLKWTIGAAPLHVLAMFAGLPWGAVGVAWGVSLSFCVVRVPYWYYTFKGTPLRVEALLGMVVQALGVVVPSALIASILSERMGWTGIAGFAVVLSLYGALFIVIDLILFQRKGLCFQLLEVKKYIKQA